MTLKNFIFIGALKYQNFHHTKITRYTVCTITYNGVEITGIIVSFEGEVLDLLVETASFEGEGERFILDFLVETAFLMAAATLKHRPLST